MNLIQIQEHLKDMPTQAIMAYANGQNPMVPPYLALGEMNRRKQMEKRAAEPPQGSVKDKLEQEIMQPQGITQGMPQQGMPPQGMPQGAPQGMPQGELQGMPPQAPPQMAPQGMAGGGLTNLPMRSDRFNYAPGGIVAFADGDLVKLPEQAAADVMTKQLAGESDIPMPVSREDERAALIAKDPRMAAYLNKVPGEAMTGLMGQLQAQNAAQKQQFQEQQSGQGLGTLANALMNAAEGTRGRKGSGLGEAFIGFGKTYTAAQAEDYKRKQEQAAIERAQTIEMAKLQSDVDNMQRAFAEGRVEDGMKYKAAVEARQAKIAELQGLRAKDVITAAETSRHNRETALRDERRDKRQAQHYSAQEAQSKRANDLAEATKPTAEERVSAQIQARVNNDPAIRVLSKKLGEAELNSDEYYQILDNMREITLTHYPEGSRAAVPPPVKRLAAPPPPPKKGWFGDTINPTEPPTGRPSAVPFSQLPK